MADRTLKTLSTLVARATALQVAGNIDAAVTLTHRAIADLEQTSDEDIRVVVAGLLGFISALQLVNDQRAVATELVSWLDEVVEHGDAASLRSATASIFQALA